jgi:hypothetical protein
MIHGLLPILLDKGVWCPPFLWVVAGFCQLSPQKSNSYHQQAYHYYWPRAVAFAPPVNIFVLISKSVNCLVYCAQVLARYPWTAQDRDARLPQLCKLKTALHHTSHALMMHSFFVSPLIVLPPAGRSIIPFNDNTLLEVLLVYFLFVQPFSFVNCKIVVKVLTMVRS